MSLARSVIADFPKLTVIKWVTNAVYLMNRAETVEVRARVKERYISSVSVGNCYRRTPTAPHQKDIVVTLKHVVCTQLLR